MWKLGKLNEISDEQAREDLGAALGADDGDRRPLGARWPTARRAGPGRRRRAGRDRRREVPAALARRGRPAARQGDRHLLDLHRRARPQRLDLHRARRRLDRRRLRRGALVGGRRALRPAARRRAGVREADARRGRRELGDPEQLGARRARRRASGSWASATASTAPRTRARGSSSATAQELGSPQVEVAEQLEAGRARRRCSERHPERVLETNVEYYSAVVLDVAEIPPPLAPAMFACSRVAGWSAHILEQKRTGRLIRPSARYVGPGRRDRSSVGLTPRRGRGAGRRARRERATSASSPSCAREWDGRARGGGAVGRLPRARGRLPRDRPVPLPPEDRAAAARARGREPGLPRLGAALARAALARPPGRRSTSSGRCCTSSRTRDDNEAVRRLAIVALRNGSPQRDTIVAARRGSPRTTSSSQRDCGRPPRRSPQGSTKRAKTR